MNEPAPPKKRTWLWVLLGVFFLLVVFAIGGIIFSVSFLRQNMSVASMSPASADEEFNAVRAKFAGQPPLIQFVDGRPEYDPDRAGRSSPAATPLKTMHVMAWDHDEEQLVRFSLPMWLLRLKSGPIQLSAYSQGWDDRGVSFRVEDLERHGPGLLMDLDDEEREGQILIWVE
jgi:hypothetical protein